MSLKPLQTVRTRWCRECCLKHENSQYAEQESNESVKNMDGTFAGWSGMV